MRALIEISKSSVICPNDSGVDIQDVKGFSLNQLELHPRVSQQEAVEATASAGAIVQSYSPFGTGDLLASKQVVELAKSSGLSPCQLLLQYAFAKGRSMYDQPAVTYDSSFIHAYIDLCSLSLSVLSQAAVMVCHYRCGFQKRASGQNKGKYQLSCWAALSFCDAGSRRNARWAPLLLGLRTSPLALVRPNVSLYL